MNTLQAKIDEAVKDKKISIQDKKRLMKADIPALQEGLILATARKSQQ
jgi:hypothetical protein